MPVENIVGKEENAAFSPFPTMFSTLPNTNFNFSVTFILSSANVFNLYKSIILSSSKVLKGHGKQDLKTLLGKEKMLVPPAPMFSTLTDGLTDLIMGHKSHLSVGMIVDMSQHFLLFPQCFPNLLKQIQ